LIFYFHGGDYSSLSGSSNRNDGTRLAGKGDVVVVTVNHRLNVFGYLYLAAFASEFADSGNVGMLDLVAALRWVRDNIAGFGGDPRNVTIFGQSGGGAKVSTMLAMPAANGLFHRAIIQSGSYARNAHLEAMTPELATRRTYAMMKALAISPPDVGKLVAAPMEALVAAFAKVARQPGHLYMRPVADGRSLPSGPWWPTAPAASADVPLIIGSTETEMTLMIGSYYPGTFTLDETGLRQWLGSLFTASDVEPVIAGFRATRPNATPSDLFFAITTANSLRKGNWLQADLKAAQGGAPVWLYELDWHTSVDGGKWGSPHAVDAALVFDNAAISASMVGSGPDPQRIADQMTSAWLAFARTGDPNGEAMPHWPAYKPPERTTMVIDRQSKAVDYYRDDERKLLIDLKSRGPLD
jgi:para-nitrobenzyl esterase